MKIEKLKVVLKRGRREAGDFDSAYVMHDMMRRYVSHFHWHGSKNQSITFTGCGSNQDHQSYHMFHIILMR